MQLHMAVCCATQLPVQLCAVMRWQRTAVCCRLCIGLIAAVWRGRSA